MNLKLLIKKGFIAFPVIAIVVIISCSKNLNEPLGNLNSDPSHKLGTSLLDVSFTLKITRTFENQNDSLSDLDIATLNPGCDKQSVQMQLFENGQLHVIIEELDMNEQEQIKIPHQVIPDDFPKIRKTEIIGNSASFYNEHGELMTSTPIELPNQMGTVNKIRELGDKFTAADINSALATMRGFQFIDNLEQFIDEAPANGIQVLEQGDNYVTLRMPLNKVDSRLTDECVLLIDKGMNKLVGSRIYSANNELLQSTLYGYNQGEVQSLSAIVVEQKVPLPSGNEVKMTLITKIEDLQFSMNTSGH